MTRLQTYLAELQRFGIRPGLERIQALLQSAGNPQSSYPIILVGGTNGKGSTCEFLSQMLCRDGLRVGLFTSPHLYQWNERIRVLQPHPASVQLPAPHMSTHVARELFAGAISDHDLDALFDAAKPHLESVAAQHDQPTEFETVTFLGLWHFARAAVDVAVVEVGLGGTWDATNVCEPVVSVITHVALDHCDRLGDTVQAIARDKAGIARANRVLVTGETKPDVLQVLREECDARHARLWPFRAPNYSNDRAAFEQATTRLSPDFIHPINSASDNSASDKVQTEATRESNAGAPSFQRLNEATAWVARAAWLECDPSTRSSSAANDLAPHEYSCGAPPQDSPALQVPGRAETLRLEPRVLIDGANNPDGAAHLANYLRALLESGAQGGDEKNEAASRLILVPGILEDKDWRAMIAVLAPLAHRVIATQSGSPRAARAGDIAEEARRYVSAVEIATPVSRAVERALQLARVQDIVCVCGSFYTVAEVSREAVQAWPRNLFVHSDNA